MTAEGGVWLEHYAHDRSGRAPAEFAGYEEGARLEAASTRAPFDALRRDVRRGPAAGFGRRWTGHGVARSAATRFLGYRIGRNHRPDTGAAYIGTRPSRESVQSICRRVSEATTRRDGLLPPSDVVARLNRLLTGWGTTSSWGRSGRPTRRLTTMPPGGCASGSVASTRCGPGDTCDSRTSGSDSSTGSPALRCARRASRGRRHDLVREPDAGNPHVRFDERRLETESWRGVRHRRSAKAAGNGYPLRLPPPRQSSTLHECCRYPDEYDALGADRRGCSGRGSGRGGGLCQTPRRWSRWLSRSSRPKPLAGL